MSEAAGGLRVGTWNLAGRWSAEHANLMADQRCHVWLLTEVLDDIDLDGYHGHFSEGVMVGRRRWAAVLSQLPLQERPDPHQASAAAEVDGITYCSSILPWRSCGSKPPWVGIKHADKTSAAVKELVEALPNSGLVWGGDWNHALLGKEYAGSVGGRGHVLAAMTSLGLKAPTEALPHRIDGLLSIDHIAVHLDTKVIGAHRVPARRSGHYLSDHDAYIVDIA